MLRDWGKDAVLVFCVSGRKAAKASPICLGDIAKVSVTLWHPEIAERHGIVLTSKWPFSVLVGLTFLLIPEAHWTVCFRLGVLAGIDIYMKWTIDAELFFLSYTRLIFEELKWNRLEDRDSSTAKCFVDIQFQFSSFKCMWYLLAELSLLFQNVWQFIFWGVGLMFCYCCHIVARMLVTRLNWSKE